METLAAHVRGLTEQGGGGRARCRAAAHDRRAAAARSGAGRRVTVIRYLDTPRPGVLDWRRRRGTAAREGLSGRGERAFPRLRSGELNTVVRRFRQPRSGENDGNARPAPDRL